MALGTITQQALIPGSTDTSDPGVLYLGNGLKLTFTTVIGDGAYVAGGSALTPAQLGFANYVQQGFVLIVGSTGANDGAVSAALAGVPGASPKLKCFVTAGVSPVGVQEAAAAANLSGLTFLVVALGY